jgi:hypothetical protein
MSDEFNPFVNFSDQSNPEEAAKNILNAGVFNVNPSSYKEMADPELDQEAERRLKPQVSPEPIVAEYRTQSTEHTALTQQDLPLLNGIEKAWTFAGDIIFNRDNDETRLIKLNLKRLDNPGQLTGDEEIELLDLRHQLMQKARNQPPDFLDSVGEGVAETVRTVRRNAPLIAGFTGSGALLGSTGGLPGAAAGAGLGFSTGVASAFATDTYDKMRGLTYNELSQFTDKDGNPVDLDEDTKRKLSNGLGFGSAILSGIVGGKLTKTAPWLSKFVTPTMAKELILNPAYAATFRAMNNIGEAMAVGGGASALIEVGRIVTNEIAQTWDGTEVSFTNGLIAAGEKAKEYAGRVAEAGAVGAVTTGVVATGVNALMYPGMKAEYARRSEQALRNMKPPPEPPMERDVTPDNLRALPPPTREIPASSGPKPPPPPGGGGGLKLLGQGTRGEQNIRKSIDVLHAQDALELTIKHVKSMVMEGFAPERVDDAIAYIAEKVGLTKFFVPRDKVEALAKSAKNQQMFADLLDPSGATGRDMNQPVEIPIARFVRYAMTNPELGDLLQVRPDGPTVDQARKFLTGIQDAEVQRIKVFKELGIETPMEGQTGPDNVTQIPEERPESPNLESETSRLNRAIEDVDKTVAHNRKVMDEWKTELQSMTEIDKERGAIGIDKDRKQWLEDRIAEIEPVIESGLAKSKELKKERDLQPGYVEKRIKEEIGTVKKGLITHPAPVVVEKWDRDGEIKEVPKLELPEEVSKAFDDFAHSQRGKPETAMSAIQKHHSGLLSFLVEHVGDLTHRMAEMPTQKNAGRVNVEDKVRKTLSTLRHSYGWLKEHEENIRAQVDYLNEKGEKTTVEEYKKKLDSLLANYAKEHKKLTPYNRLQYLAQQAAVALGKKRWDDAEMYLSMLEKVLDNPDKFEYLRQAGEYTLDAKGRLVSYVGTFGYGEKKAKENFTRLQELESTLKNLDPNHGDLLIGPWEFDVEGKANSAEEEYMSTTVYPQVFLDIIPKTERIRFEAAVMEAKKSIKEDIDYTLQNEMEKVIDEVDIIAEEAAAAEENSRLENSNALAVIDRFAAHQMEGENGRKRSIYLIDPASLRDDQLHYLDNPIMKKRQVFGKKGEGNRLEDAAELIGGVTDGDELLKFLSFGADRDQLVTARVKAGEAQRQSRIRDSVPLNWHAKLRSYDRKTYLAARMMNYLRDYKWTELKKGIKRISFPPPQVKQIKYDAREAVLQTPIKDLNVQKWKVAENVSRKNAITNMLKSMPDKAYSELEKQARAIQMQKQTAGSIGQINRTLRFSMRVQSPAGQRRLRKAGKTYVDSVNFLLSLFAFNTDPSTKNNLALRDAYIETVQKLLRSGQGDFEMPAEFLDFRQHFTEMTVEQFLTVADKIRAIYQLAGYKNRLSNKWRLQKEVDAIEVIREAATEKLKDHPGNKDRNFDPVQERGVHTVSDWYSKGIRGLQTFDALIGNLDHVLRQLDIEDTDGFFAKLIGDRIRGSGQWEGKGGYLRELELTRIFKEHFEALIAEYGKADFKVLDSKIIEIPEFKGVKELNDGQLTKAQLMVLWAYGGDPYLNPKRTTNLGGVSLQVIQKVLDRELEIKDVRLMQKLVDMYKDYRPETAALQRRTRGEDVVFVEGIPNFHRGVAYSGGYVPTKYVTDFQKEAVDSTLREIEDAKAAFFQKGGIGQLSKRFSGEMTEQGRLIQREGSRSPLDLSFVRFVRGHEEVIHDLCYREVAIDTLKILRDKEIKAAIIRAVGRPKYNILVSTIIELATRMQAENANYFSDSTRMVKDLLRHVKNNFDIQALGFKATTMLIQFSSLSQVVMNAGPGILFHMGFTAKKLMRNPKLTKAAYELAVEIDPTIGHWMESLDNALISNVMKLTPRKKQKYGIFGSIDVLYSNYAVRPAMAGMMAVDVLVKTINAVAAYSQYMAGDGPVSKAELAKMSDKERVAAAKAWAYRISRLSLTHGRKEDQAPIQKIPIVDVALAYYFNDARNMLNNLASFYRSTLYDTKDVIEGVKLGVIGLGQRGGGIGGGGSGGGDEPPPPPAGGDDEPPSSDDEGRREKIRKEYEKNYKAWRAAARVGGRLLGVLTLLAVTRAYQEWVHGSPQSVVSDLRRVRNWSKPEPYNYMLQYMLEGPFDLYTSDHWASRPIKWSINNVYQKSLTKRIDVPLTKSASDVATTVFYYKEWMYDRVPPTDTQEKAINKTWGLFLYAMPWQLEGVEQWKKIIGADKWRMPGAKRTKLNELENMIDNWKEYTPPDATEEEKKAVEDLDQFVRPLIDKKDTK